MTLWLREGLIYIVCFFDEWRIGGGEKFTDLVFDAERCSRQHIRPRCKDGEDHIVAVFTSWMLRGQVRFAVRFITDRVSGGGVLAYDSPSVVLLANLL